MGTPGRLYVNPFHHLLRDVDKYLYPPFALLPDLLEEVLFR